MELKTIFLGTQTDKQKMRSITYSPGRLYLDVQVVVMSRKCIAIAAFSMSAVTFQFELATVYNGHHA